MLPWNGAALATSVWHRPIFGPFAYKRLQMAIPVFNPMFGGVGLFLVLSATGFRCTWTLTARSPRTGPLSSTHQLRRNGRSSGLSRGPRKQLRSSPRGRPEKNACIAISVARCRAWLRTQGRAARRQSVSLESSWRRPLEAFISRRDPSPGKCTDQGERLRRATSRCGVTAPTNGGTRFVFEVERQP